MGPGGGGGCVCVCGGVCVVLDRPGARGDKGKAIVVPPSPSECGVLLQGCPGATLLLKPGVWEVKQAKSLSLSPSFPLCQVGIRMLKPQDRCGHALMTRG